MALNLAGQRSRKVEILQSRMKGSLTSKPGQLTGLKLILSGGREQAADTHSSQVIKIDLAAFSFCLPVNPLFTQISVHYICTFGLHHLLEFLSVRASILDPPCRH